MGKVFEMGDSQRGLQRLCSRQIRINKIVFHRNFVIKISVQSRREAMIVKIRCYKYHYNNYSYKYRLLFCLYLFLLFILSHHSVGVLAFIPVRVVPFILPSTDIAFGRKSILGLTSSSSTSSSSSSVPLSYTSTEKITKTQLTMSSSTSTSPAHEFVLNPNETAIVFIEYQNEFTSPGGKLYDAVKPCMDKTNMLENSIKLVSIARECKCTIIHCPISFERGHYEISKTPYGILDNIKSGSAFTAGEWNSDFYPPMRPTNGDLIVKGKSGLCGFMSTNLDFLLSQHGCKNLILAGFLANCCVESTMRTGYEKGYKVYTVSDCVAATSIDAMEATIQHNYGMFSIVTTSTAIINSLSSSLVPAA
jgi:nicotinamidase-related amidase